jgi:hypothetical protein
MLENVWIRMSRGLQAQYLGGRQDGYTSLPIFNQREGFNGMM